MKQVIPAGVLEQHVIALGKTRAGKSSKLRVLVEQLLRAGEPTCVIDPKGDWWGLKSSADGKRAGFPVVIFGGEHADVPINEHSGAHVAELIATGNRPALIDLGGWMVGARTRFFIAFASTFFKLTRGRRYLVIDEVHNFAPQGKILSPEAGESLHWANRLASEGSGKGVTIIAASQRPQKVHKDFLTSCETLIACRVIHKLDRDAIKDWIDGCADPALGKRVLGELAGMKRPEAWVWSPEINYGPELVKFPMFETYDSFKPQDAHAGKLKGWADVDLEEVKAKLATVVQEAEASDPKKLKARVAELEAMLRNAATNEAPKTNTAALDEQSRQMLMHENRALEQHRDALAGAVAALREHAKTMYRSIEQAHETAEAAFLALPHPPPFPAITKPSAPARVAAQPLPRVKAAASPAPRPSSLSKPEFAFLRALWWLRDEERTPEKVSFYAGYSVTSSSFGNTLGALRSAGLVERLEVTAAGQELIAATAGAKPSGRDLREWVRPKLSKAENAFLDVLIAASGYPLRDEVLAERAGYSITSSSFGNSLGKLRSIGAAQGYGRDGGTRAADVFLS